MIRAIRNAPSHTVFFSLIILLSASGCGVIDTQPLPPVSNDTTPLNEQETFTWNGLSSGLYPWGNDWQSNAFEQNYENTCAQIFPTSGNGNHTGGDKIVMLGIGGSNPAIMYNGFTTAQQNDPGFGDNLLFLNGGINSMDFSNLLDPATGYWQQMNNLLSDNNMTANDVQIIFCIEDDLKQRDTSLQRVYTLKEDYTNLLTIIRTNYPNCKLMLIADRGYSGYSTDPKHQEPVGYLNGWGVKLLIQDYIDNKLPEYPVVNWLDYYWADGENPRWDGLTYSQSDFRAPDYVHFTQEKADALAAITHQKLKEQPGTSYWYK